MPGILIAAVVVYGIFQLMKYLMGGTVGDARSHVVGNWYSDSHSKGANRDLITFTKCVSAFVLRYCCIPFLTRDESLYFFAEDDVPPGWAASLLKKSQVIVEG